MKRAFISFCLIACQVFIPVHAQKAITVEGKYTYHVPENVSDEDARRIALERAMLNALSDAFGTMVSQVNTTYLENRNGKSQSDFRSYGGSEVRGEWLETIGEPTFDCSYQQGQRIIIVHVKGKARQIPVSRADFKTDILRNGSHFRGEDDYYLDGDKLSLTFQSPVSGFLCIYMLDEQDNNVYGLLPYPDDTGKGAYPIIGNEKYTFFTGENGQNLYDGDIYVYCQNRSIEYNVLYILFSPHKFSRPIASHGMKTLANGDKSPTSLPLKDFNKWLIKTRNEDIELNCKTISIKIKKQEQ